jgi:uncharacterized delta-60 repeat protein
LALLLAIGALVSAGVTGQAIAAKGGSVKGKGRGTKDRLANKAGRLDSGFNGDGKVVVALPSSDSRRGSPNYQLPFEFAPGRIVMAAAGGGKLVVAGSKAIVEYLANGRPNPHFGGKGAVPIGRIEGTRFQLADVAVDSKGRVLIAGTAKPENEVGLTGPEVPGPLATVATIRRYLPNGRLDPGFGLEGVLNTDLGAQPPTFEGQPYPEAAVSVLGLAVDQTDRPILTGSAVAEVGLCAPSQNRYQRSQAIVARLTPDGLPDTSFADSGIKSIGGLSWLASPMLNSSGVISVGFPVDPCPRGGGPEAPSVLTSLGSYGGLMPFAGDGFWSRPYTRISDVAAAPSGKLVLLARTIELSHGQWFESAGEAVRLRPNGSFDTGFGHRGHANVELPKHSSIAAIATDAKGRVLLAGTVLKGRGKKRQAQLRFLLIRTTVAGEADERFGRSGRVMTAFGDRGNIRAGDVLIDPSGRIVVGGKFSGPAANGAFAIARYLGGK